MSDAGPARGRCLCGAVTVEVAGGLPDFSACHCDNCARWSGGVFFSAEVPAAAVTLSGRVKTHAATAFSERGWCDTCGSAVYLRDTGAQDTGHVELMPGLFANFGGGRLDHVVYADRCPDGLTIGAGVRRVTASAYEAENPHQEAAP